MAEKLGDVFPVDYRFVFSMGGSSLPAATRAKTKRDSTLAQNGDAWMLFGYAGSGERYQAALDVLFAASKDPPSAASTLAGVEHPARNRFVRINKRFEDLPPESIVFRSDAAKGSSYFVWALPGADWIWSLGAPTEARLLAQARQLVPQLSAAAAPDAEQLGALEGTSPLFAGSINLAALRDMYPEALRDVELPFGGSPRVFVRATGERRPAQPHDKLSLVIWSRWSPAAVADLVVAIKAYQKHSEQSP